MLRVESVPGIRRLDAAATELGGALALFATVLGNAFDLALEGFDAALVLLARPYLAVLLHPAHNTPHDVHHDVQQFVVDEEDDNHHQHERHESVSQMRSQDRIPTLAGC